MGCQFYRRTILETKDFDGRKKGVTYRVSSTSGEYRMVSQRCNGENVRIDRAQRHFFDMAEGIGHDQTAFRIRVPNTYPRAGFCGDHFIRDVRIFTHAVPHHAKSRHRLHSRWLQQIHHLREKNSQNYNVIKKYQIHIHHRIYNLPYLSIQKCKHRRMVPLDYKKYLAKRRILPLP